MRDTGKKEDRYMKKKIKYSNEDLGSIQVVKDFLPSPDELVLKQETVKITLNVNKSSVDFFKGIAQKHGSQYQKVIRNLLDSYSSHFTR